jgi:DNA-binding FrmR family transcriptional regulator
VATNDEAARPGAARPAQQGERLAPAAKPPAAVERVAERAVQRAVERPIEQDVEISGDASEVDSVFRHSYTRDQSILVRRLRRIEGQARGIERMIERKEYCIDILQQTAALRAAVDSVALLILEDHVQGCVRTAAEEGDADRYVEEVLDVVRRTLGKPVRPRV